MTYYLPSLTVLLVFACLVAYEYIRDLRRENKALKADASKAWQLYNGAHRELCAIKGQPAPDPYAPEQRSRQDTGSAPFIPTGIGPTAIADGEMRRQMQEERERNAEPPFASPATLNPELGRHPTAEQIAAAARAAAGNHGGRQ